MIRHLPPLVSALLACSPAPRAQEPNVLPMQRAYHAGIYSGEIDAGGALRLYGGLGEMSTTLAGGFSGTLDEYETDATGTTFAAAQPFGGDYTVRGDGLALLDLNPANPGTELQPIWITPDGAVMHGVTSMAGTTAATLVLVAKGTGLSDATLSGTYRFVSQRVRFSGSDWNVEQDFGTATFDGAGNGTAAITNATWTNAGPSTSTMSGALSYVVQPDGALSIAGDQGAVLSDGEMFFLLQADLGGRVGMVFGVRVGTSYDFRDLTGRHSFLAHSFELDTTPNTPHTQTVFAEIGLTGTTANGGTWARAGVVVDNRATGGITLNPAAAFGSGTLGSTGRLQLTPGGYDLRVSDGARFFIGNRGTTTNTATHVFGARMCRPAAPIGTGTAGTGGRVPRLGMRTFPVLGNAGFAYAIENALPGSVAVVPIATAPSPGLPAFGGQVFVDPASVGYTPAVVLDAAGRGLTALPIPNNPALVSVGLWAQALVLDPLATGDIALSAGYGLTICR